MRRRQMLTTLAGLAATASAAAAAPDSPARSTADAIIEIDRQLNRAILAHDVKAASAFYDDDFILTVSGGGTKRKADMLRDIGNPEVVLQVCDTTEVAVRVRGTTAVLTGVLLQKGTVGSRPLDVKLHVTDTWVQVDSRWLLLAGHASFVK